MKRCVSLKCLPARDWSKDAVNTNFESEARLNGSTRDLDMKIIRSSCCSSVHHPRNSSRTKVHETWQIIYQWKRLTKHNNNINTLWPNSKYPAQIDQKKIWHQTFNSRFLTQNLMKFKTSISMDRSFNAHHESMHGLT